MCRFTNRIYQLLVRFYSLIYFLVIKEVFFLVLTPVIVSSFFLLFLSFLPLFDETFLFVFWKHLCKTGDLLNPLEACWASISLGVCVFVALKLAKHYSLDKDGLILTVLICFFLTVPYEMSLTWSLGTPLVYLGSQGMVASVISSLITVQLFRLFSFTSFKANFHKSAPFYSVSSFSTVFPCFLSVSVFWVLLQVLKFFFLPFDLFITQVFSKPLLEIVDSLQGALALVFSSSIFTFLGFRGESFLQTLAFPSLLQTLLNNGSTYCSEIPCEHVVVKSFFDVYVNLGGVGATLPLVICMTFLSRSSHLRSVGKLSLLTSIFNINEPLLFGLPLIFNPFMIVPFLLTPLVLTGLTYYATLWGWLPRCAGVMLPSTVPVFISGYLTSGGYYRGAIWQAINLAIATLIYYPFFYLNDCLLRKM